MNITSNQLDEMRASILKRMRDDSLCTHNRASDSKRLISNMRSRVSQAISRGSGKKARKTVELIGCEVNELIEHLESKFTDGMTMANYGKWHVDHIKPCALFDMKLDSEQKLCFHYSNLQPLWAEDNLLKSDKYEQ